MDESKEKVDNAPKEDKSLEANPEEAENASEEAVSNDSKPEEPREERKMYKTTCSDCGQEAEVPFEPEEGKDVYCKECYQKRRPRNQNGWTGNASLRCFWGSACSSSSIFPRPGRMPWTLT